MKHATAPFDFSTINIAKLKALPVLKLAPSYRLQEDPGNGCAFDPPGYPTYFTRSVYTAHGNSPRKGPETVITVPAVGSFVVASDKDWISVKNWDDYHAKIQDRLKSLWIPLPLAHPRVEAWIAQAYSHLAHCYQDVDMPEYGKPGTLIYPVPSYKLKPMMRQEYTPAGIPKHADAYLEAENFARMTFNVEEETRAAAIAIPANHQAVIMIRRYYPEHQPRLDWIDGTSKPPRSGNWWERHAEPFTAENCPGQYGHAHPVNGSWCQMCGLDAKAENAA